MGGFGDDRPFRVTDPVGELSVFILSEEALTFPQEDGNRAREA